MAGPPGKHVKQFSKDTAFAMHYTCYVVVDLCKDSLFTSHNYVLFGQFTFDHLKKEYRQLRQGCEEAYI